jgi:hypothetical protein
LPFPYFNIKHPNILDSSKSKFRASRCEETTAPRENLRHLRAPIQVAKEVGAGLGRSEILQRPLPDEKIQGPSRVMSH